MSEPKTETTPPEIPYGWHVSWLAKRKDNGLYDCILSGPNGSFSGGSTCLGHTPCEAIQKAVSDINQNNVVEPIIGCPFCGHGPIAEWVDDEYFLTCANDECPVHPSARGFTEIETRKKWNTRYE